MHDDLSETALFSVCDSRGHPLTRCWYPTHPITMGTHLLTQWSEGSWEQADGRYAAGLFLQPPARGSGSAATSGTQPFDYAISEPQLMPWHACIALSYWVWIPSDNRNDLIIRWFIPRLRRRALLGIVGRKPQCPWFNSWALNPRLLILPKAGSN